MEKLKTIRPSIRSADRIPVTIVGAGPVGLLLAGLLGRQGREVRVIEQREKKPAGSMAIGITPPSLDILEKLDLKSAFVNGGVTIEKARVFENRMPVGELDFRKSENAILSFPQIGTLTLLEEKVSEFSTVSVERGKKFTEQDLEDAEGWVIACDGSQGTLREMAGIPGRGHTYGVGFVMADFPDEEKLGADARLYFSAEGAVESFPLPQLLRRWIAQVTSDAGMDLLRSRVLAAAGIDLQGRESGPLNAFSPRWFLANQYVKDKVILCGDAAHVMSPIGGQGMNTGFGDAMMLAEILRDPTPVRLSLYTSERKKAFRIAARRAALGMWLGTRLGVSASRARATLLKILLHSQVSEKTLVRCYSMRNLPHPCNS